MCKLMSRTILFGFAAALVAYPAASLAVPPPPAPNVCADAFCVEATSIAAGPGRGFVRASVEIESANGISSMTLVYKGYGRVTLQYPAAPAERQRAGGLDVPISCRGKACGTVTITATGSTAEITERLKCQVLSVWLIEPGAFYVTGREIRVRYRGVAHLKLDRRGICISSN
jgi:hypothetical protein